MAAAVTTVHRISSSPRNSFFSDHTMEGVFPSTGVNWEAATVHELLELLRYPCHRAQALSILSKKRMTEKSLALVLWNTFNISSMLIQEVTSIYPCLSPDLLTEEDSNRVCNALTLFQCLASHPDTKGAFLNALMPCYVYPFLETKEKRRPFEHLRLYSLGVIAALLEEDGPIVKPTVLFLIESKVVSMCLRCLDMGEEFTQSVAAMIFARILMEPEGLKHCCGISEHFFGVNNVFISVVEKMGDTPSSPRLLKNIINCYLRMSESPRVCSVLARALPPKLRTMPFINAVQEDRESMLALKNLFENVNAGHKINQQPLEPVINNFQNTRMGYWQN